MLITDKKELQKYNTPYRIWQGIPSIEVTKKGRIFSCFYSGGISEEFGNFALLTKSDDGVTFSEPIAVAFKENYRCFDPCIWIDPLGRLWFYWAIQPLLGVYGAICDDPDAEELKWSDVFFIGHDVMLNKPTVLSSGEWLFPIAVWDKKTLHLPTVYYDTTAETGAFAYKSVDQGKSFEKLGGICMFRRQFDEHTIIELSDGLLAMYVRTGYGIGVAYSYDRGKTWTENSPQRLNPDGTPGAHKIFAPGTRNHVRRLRSGRLLLITNDHTTQREKMTLFLSEDDGASWKYKMCIDERESTYPDATEADDGFIYVTYDHERGVAEKSLQGAYSKAREILYAKVTEKDIMAGKVTSKGSRLKCVVSKLGAYEGEDDPYAKPFNYSGAQLAEVLLHTFPDRIVEKLCEYYPLDCTQLMHLHQNTKLDALLQYLQTDPADAAKIVVEIAELVRNAAVASKFKTPLVLRLKEWLAQNYRQDISVTEIAGQLGCSVCYIQHQFKKSTGITIVEYRNELRLTEAKKMLVHTQKSVTEIAGECGFSGPSYFAELFQRSERMSPTTYRERLTRSE